MALLHTVPTTKQPYVYALTWCRASNVPKAQWVQRKMLDHCAPHSHRFQGEEGGGGCVDVKRLCDACMDMTKPIICMEITCTCSIVQSGPQALNAPLAVNGHQYKVQTSERTRADLEHLSNHRKSTESTHGTFSSEVEPKGGMPPTNTTSSGYVYVLNQT
jgi:hypothetical protein